MHTEPPHLELLVKAVTWEAPGIHAYELRSPTGAELPPFESGAHVDLSLPGGLTRSYSLINPQAERHRYVIAVQRDRASRGGSLWVHQELHSGDLVKVSAPRNNFALNEQAALSLLIAGGIGITPILCMLRRLAQLGLSWELYYCARTRKDAAFVDELAALQSARGKVNFNFDQEPGGSMLDIAALAAGARAEAHLYCCGPLPMLAAFEQATAKRDPAQVHVEYFSATEPPATAGGFEVVLAKSGRRLTVAPGKTILDAVLESGVDAPYSCMEGVCGTCETKVLEGEPDHRDLILSKAEQQAGRTMMICCSGCKSAKLVLDL